MTLIYKQTLDNNGNPSKIELIELDPSEHNATKFLRLFNLQIPHDIRNKVSYHHLNIRVAS